MTYHEVRVLLVSRSLLLALVDGCSLLHLVVHAVLGDSRFRAVCLTIYQRIVAILVAAQIASQRKNVLRGVLVHWRIGCRAYHDDGVCGIAYHEHQHAEQCGVLQTCANQRLAGILAAHHHPQQSQHDGSDDEGAPSISVEWYAQQTYGCREGDVLSQQALVLLGLIDSPYHGADEKQHVYDKSGIELHTQRVDEEQLKPSAYGDDAWHNAIKHGSHQYERQCQSYERSFQVGVRHTLVVVYQHYGRDAEQVQQVDSDAQSSHVCYQYQPAVAMRLIGMVFPFQYQPEHHCGECRRVGIYLTLDSRIPERVAKCIYQRAHQSRCFYGYDLAQSQRVPVLQYQSSHQVGDGPEQEHYTCG